MPTTKDILQLFWRQVRRYPYRVLLGLIVLPLAQLGNSFLPPLIVSGVLQRLASGDFKPSDPWGSFGADILLYLFITLMGAVVLWRVVSITIWRLEMRVVQDLHNHMFAHLMQLDSNFHANHFGGSLVSQVNKLASAYVNIQDVFIWEIYPLVLSVAFSAAILYPKAPLYVVALLLLSALFVASTIAVSRATRRFNVAEAAASNKLTGILADAITNIAAIKSFARHKFEENHYAHAVQKWRKAETGVMYATAVRQTVFASITTSIATMSLALAVVSVVVFKADVATVFLVVSYTGIVIQSLWEFGSQTMRTYNRAMGDAKGMVEILNTHPTVADKPNTEKPRIVKGAISFNAVTFTHNEAKNDDILFRNLSLAIPAGKKVGLVGHSGSGKTTLTRLLLRFADIHSGSITIDGQNIAAITQDNLRSYIAYVPQEPLLFHRSLRENIAYGKPSATDAEIHEAARKAHAHEFIQKLPKGYDTEVGERGVKLSGGQRQRIAIARAILKDAPILVLDEATSALDSESEQLIQAALWQLMQGRTAIVIAHRLSTIQKMDHIVVLQDGKILEHGDHQSLLNAKGTYAGLWAHQSGGFLED